MTVKWLSGTFITIDRQPGTWLTALCSGSSLFRRAWFLPQRFFALERRDGSIAEHENFGEFAAKLGFVPVVTREQVQWIPGKRIPDVPENGELEGRAGISLDQERNRIMICSNTDMVEERRG